ncbi:cytochrome c nitrite reductase small subunit [Maribacter sp. 1_MG-2023]|uniref:cytochrome c nitrite reductase small subunit n=1 Tax=Maribacter sp. 1_MG-2023 TaxID=3062677 RepID=UPI0026E1B385|nr:cytochrome c nitrite reductase small subunit [Maribacter sp. 1_MG-2023]MDO6472572.1 cytochrome c nitrite reductase small subunit [Maribacter sp. 1_MG-2023]
MRFKSKILPKKGSSLRSFAVFSLAAIIGIGFFLMKEGEVLSYMSDNPQACVNCHVMTPVYNSWMHSSHREWVSCNGCHVPQNNVVNAYYFKAMDGLYHASIFTARAEPEVIFMREGSQEVVQNNCIRCHVQQVTQTKYDGFIEGHKENRTERQCWSCHKEVPHGRIHGMSTVKYNIAPLPTDQEETVIPAWLEKEMATK